MKVKELVMAARSLQKLDTLNFPVDIAFDICQMVDTLQVSLGNFNKCKEKLLVKYGTKNKENNLLYDIPVENIPEFNAALDKLYEKNIKFTDKVTIKLKDLVDESIKMSADDIRLTKPFINYIKEE